MNTLEEDSQYCDDNQSRLDDEIAILKKNPESRKDF